MNDYIDINLLLNWFKKNKRDLPWRKTKNPYHIWVSEIMLQQTQVQTVIPYYHRFLDRFPTLQDFANAPDNLVMKAWEGLGYYSRVRNMQTAARQILDDYNGEFPKTAQTLLKLKGFGPYTSASVASLAFGDHAVAVDGNVKRVISRLFVLEEDISKITTVKKITQLAETLSRNFPAGEFNEAMMELGATVCTSKSPLCSACPLSTECKAFQLNTVEKYPFKSKRKPVPHYNIAVGIILNSKNEILIALRPKDGLLGNLWEFPGGKQQPDETLDNCCLREIKEELDIEIKIIEKLTTINHAYTHFKITLHAFVCLHISGRPQPKASQEIRWITHKNLNLYAFPKANKALLKQLIDYLEKSYTKKTSY